MTPSLSAPTDNIYKFFSIFGLALILTSILSFAAIYTTSLDRKVTYNEKIITLENKSQKTKEEMEILNLNKKLLKITEKNETFGINFTGAILGLGALISGLGFYNWKTKIQTRDDAIIALQKEKLQSEICKLKIEVNNLENGINQKTASAGESFTEHIDFQSEEKI